MNRIQKLLLAGLLLAPAVILADIFSDDKSYSRRILTSAEIEGPVVLKKQGGSGCYVRCNRAIGNTIAGAIRVAGKYEHGICLPRAHPFRDYPIEATVQNINQVNRKLNAYCNRTFPACGTSGGCMANIRSETLFQIWGPKTQDPWFMQSELTSKRSKVLFRVKRHIDYGRVQISAKGRFIAGGSKDDQGKHWVVYDSKRKRIIYDSGKVRRRAMNRMTEENDREIPDERWSFHPLKDHIMVRPLPKDTRRYEELNLLTRKKRKFALRDRALPGQRVVRRSNKEFQIYNSQGAKTCRIKSEAAGEHDKYRSTNEYFVLRVSFPEQQFRTGKPGSNWFEIYNMSNCTLIDNIYYDIGGTSSSKNFSVGKNGLIALEGRTNTHIRHTKYKVAHPFTRTFVYNIAKRRLDFEIDDFNTIMGRNYAMHPSGKYMAIYGSFASSGITQPQRIMIWNLETLEIFDVLAGHSSDIHHVIFNKAGDTLYSVSRDRTVRKWRLNLR